MSLEATDLASNRNGSAAESALLRRIDLTTLRLFTAVCEEKNQLSGPLAGIHVIVLSGLDRGTVCVTRARPGSTLNRQMDSTVDGRAQMSQPVRNDNMSHIAAQQSSQNSPC